MSSGGLDEDDLDLLMRHTGIRRCAEANTTC